MRQALRADPAVEGSKVDGRVLMVCNKVLPCLRGPGHCQVSSAEREAICRSSA